MGLFEIFTIVLGWDKAHRLTLAMVAGITNRLWETLDSVTALEAWERQS